MLSLAGEPLAGARVTPTVLAVSAPLPRLDGPFELSVDGEPATTDDEGRFELPRLAAGASVRLRVTSPRTFPATFDLAALAEDGTGDLAVARRAALDLEVAEARSGLTVRPVDAGRRPLPWMRRHGGLSHVRHVPFERISLGEARSMAWDVPENAALLLVEEGDAVLRRIPLWLRPDGSTHVAIGLLEQDR